MKHIHTILTLDFSLQLVLPFFERPAKVFLHQMVNQLKSKPFGVLVDRRISKELKLRLPQGQLTKGFVISMYVFTADSLGTSQDLFSSNCINTICFSFVQSLIFFLFYSFQCGK